MDLKNVHYRVMGRYFLPSTCPASCSSSYRYALVHIPVVFSRLFSVNCLFSKQDLPGMDTHFHAVARISGSFLALWCGMNLDLVCSYMTSFVVVLSFYVSFLVDVTFCFVSDWLRRCFFTSHEIGRKDSHCHDI